MSASIGYELHARNPKDFKEMAAYATELTRKVSLERLGYDITNPDENPEKEFQSFCIGDSGNAICWEDFTGGTKHLDIRAIIDQIVHHFPEVEFIYRAFGDGPVAYECVIKNGEETKIEPYGLCLYIENEDDFRHLADMAQKEELKAPYFIEKVIVNEDQRIALLYFESLSQEDLERVLNGIMDEIIKSLPQTDFYAILFIYREEFDLILRKTHVMKGKAEWQDAPKIDDRPACYDDYSGQDYDYMPFFEGVNAEIFMAIIDNRPAPVVTKNTEDDGMESLASGESFEDDDLPR